MIDDLVKKYFQDGLEEVEFLSLVKMFFRGGGDLNGLISSSGMGLMHIAVEDELLDIIKWLVGNGADIELKNSQGWTPLLLAVDSDIDGAIQQEIELTFKSTRLLVELGANIKATTPEGKTIFNIAENYGSHLKRALETIVGN